MGIRTLLEHHRQQVRRKAWADLGAFTDTLAAAGQLRTVPQAVSPNLEITALCRHSLLRDGPALLFENPRGFDVPVLGNLFGTPERVAMGMGESSVEALRDVGKLLAFLKEPDPPKGLKDAWEKLPVFRKVLDMAPRTRRAAPCQEHVLRGDEVEGRDRPRRDRLHVLLQA